MMKSAKVTPLIKKPNLERNNMKNPSQNMFITTNLVSLCSRHIALSTVPRLHFYVSRMTSYAALMTIKQ